LRDNRLGDDALAAIVRAAARHSKELRSLDLSENVLGPKGSKVARAILKYERFASLT
jgi:hypothetical protein